MKFGHYYTMKKKIRQEYTMFGVGGRQDKYFFFWVTEKSPLLKSQSYAQSFTMKIFPDLIIGDFSTEKGHTVQWEGQGHGQLKMN